MGIDLGRALRLLPEETVGTPLNRLERRVWQVRGKVVRLFPMRACAALEGVPLAHEDEARMLDLGQARAGFVSLPGDHMLEVVLDRWPGVQVRLDQPLHALGT